MQLNAESVVMTLKTYPKLTDATTDRELIRLWISFKAKTTTETYIIIAKQFLEFTGKDLRDIKLEDILLWLESYQLREASQNTINNKLAAIKSLFSLAMKTGYLRDNPAALIKTLKAKDALNERILAEEDIKKLNEAAHPGRDRTLLKLVYFLGLRVSEALGLNWSDFRENGQEVMVTIFGKGSKTRTLIINQLLWTEIQ
ncbi:MAG: phage integrase N-terminal SAM-like domain-containing protein, partial [Crocosphaera sp.]